MEEIRNLIDGEKGKFYYDNGTISFDIKHENNKITVDLEGFEHSINDKPAWCDDVCKYWYKDGRLHRLNGPAKINPYINILEYFIDGKELTKDEWKIEVNRIDLLNDL